MAKTLVPDAYELDSLLTSKYGNRINTDPFATLRGRVEGTLDSKTFWISFVGDNYLLISAAANARDVLNELQPLLTEVMGGAKPICSYDLQNDGMDETQAMPTIEWDIEDPEKRIKEIVNGRAFDNCKILNLKLNGSKKPEDYLETEEEKQERIKNARIYGKDPGNISDVENINNLNEVDLYFFIDALGKYIWRCRHEMFHKRMPETGLTEACYALEYLMYQTTRFGVELPEPAIGKHVPATPSYKAWYDFYSKHFNNNLTDEQWNAFLSAQEAGKDTSEFMPKGNWADSLNDKPQAR